MSNLSQNEIDALLDNLELVPADNPPAPARSSFVNQFEPVEDDPREQPVGTRKLYRLYDFRRPEKLSKDHLRVLRSHFGLFWRKVANYLANLSRTSVDLALVEVDQTTYKEIFVSHGVPVVMCTFCPGQDMQGMIKLNLAQIFSLVDRLMGGSGTGAIRARALTDFERSLCGEIFEKMLACYAETRQQDPFPIQILESDERLMPRSLSGDEMMVRAIYDLRIGTSTGYLNLYLPLKSLQGLLGGAGAPASHQRVAKEEMPPVVGRLPMDVSVLLGQSWMPASKVAALSPGTVLTLDQDENRPLRVRVGGVTRFAGRPGLRGNRLAVTLAGEWKGN